MRSHAGTAEHMRGLESELAMLAEQREHWRAEAGRLQAQLEGLQNRLSRPDSHARPATPAKVPRDAMPARGKASDERLKQATDPNAPRPRRMAFQPDASGDDHEIEYQQLIGWEMEGADAELTTAELEILNDVLNAQPRSTRPPLMAEERGHADI